MRIYKTFGRLGRHCLSDHLDPQTGIIWNQNWPDEKPVDYTTVDCCLVHLIRAAEVLQVQQREVTEKLWPICRLMADHLYQRGFDFPPRVKPAPRMAPSPVRLGAWPRLTIACPTRGEWLDLAKDLMAYHAKLEMSGNDCHWIDPAFAGNHVRK